MECIHDDANHISLRGCVAAPPEHRTHEGGGTSVRLLLAVRTTVPRRVDVLPVIVWDPSGDDEWPVGTRLVITGRLQRSLSDLPEGRRSRFEVVADRLVRDGPVGEG